MSRRRKKRPGLDLRLLPRPVRLLVVLMTLLAAAAVAWQQRTAPPADGDDWAVYHNQRFRVVEVADGDTVHINRPDAQSGGDTTRIRLIGVDTPETRHPQMGVMFYGPEATAFTRERTLNKSVELKLAEQQPTRDRYQRLLAYVILDNQAVLNEELIRAGMGYADYRFGHPLKERFLELQKQARRQQTGLWKTVTPDQYPAWFRD